MSEATPCPEPLEVLDVGDCSVALYALRYPSESEPGRTHDAALSADGFWSCECFPWLDEDECKHVHDARARWYARRDCAHGLTLDEDGWRICLFCALAYRRSTFLSELREDITERFRARRRAPPSPWSGQERSDDPW